MALDDLPPDLNAKATSQIGKFSLRAFKTVAALLTAILCVTFYSFRSNSLIGDGLRHLQAFRIILPGTPPRSRRNHGWRFTEVITMTWSFTTIFYSASLCDQLLHSSKLSVFLEMQ